MVVTPHQPRVPCHDELATSLPPPGPLTGVDWPVRIYTLGRFALVKNGIPHHSDRKAQKRPIELLQALIALGGRGVRQLQLEDALWPDAAGASARQSFNMALSRLRKLIEPESLHLEEGKLTLDSRRCWVDVWAFERRLHRIDKFLPAAATPPAELFQLVREVMSLMQGPFLGLEAEQHWMLPLRDKLRHRVRRLFAELGRWCGREGLCEQAIGVYHKALEIDPLAEEFHYRLMTCYAALGRHPEALAAYHYCCKALYRCLKTPPSPPTSILLQAIQQQDRNAVASHCAACRSAD